ncbi:Tetratricopeptide repeat-like superfamily protein isoform 1 [Hibiscus syriacus]|uniref:Tetratricopeptide repeat-like superfamily protein isoform 1 n=1 Tax=Hibiscus syriacus TaxID=106335 RepID=A0A6A3C2X9_HIBSY|nr:Tetratricopeptide repeat-like superfamily protein isoform 1 [Hibiscus syriacus]
MPHRDDEEHVLVLSGLWNISMTQPDDPEFPSLGIFECMAKLFHRGITDQTWLLRGQNIYIPYYAAHIIGSYTMDNPKFAEKAVHSGVIPPLMELLRGKMSWVEQRVAVRALGHLASHENTFEAVGVHEVEVISCSMEIASNCLEVVYEFIGIKARKRPKYHCDLLTRGQGGLQLQLKKSCGMGQPASVLVTLSLKLLCMQRKITQPHLQQRVSKQSVWNVGWITRSHISCRHWITHNPLFIQNRKGKHPKTRYQVIETAASSLVDLAELASLGEAITQALLQDYCKIKYGILKLKSKEAEKTLEGLWELKVEKIKRDKLMSEQEVEERHVLIGGYEKTRQPEVLVWENRQSLQHIFKGLGIVSFKHEQREDCSLQQPSTVSSATENPAAAISDTTRAPCL